MLTLRGTLITQGSEIQKGQNGRADRPFNSLQVLAINGKAEIFKVKDFSGAKREVNKPIELAVRARAYSMDNGGAGISWSCDQ